MEILSEHTDWGVFVSGAVLFSILTLVVVVYFIALIACLIFEGYDGNVLLGAICMFVMSALLITALVSGLNAGPDTYYKAIVTDYNEVYDAGYTVVGTEGKIVTLTKEDGK